LAAIKRLRRAGPLVRSSDGHQFHSGLVVLQPGEEVGEHKTGAGEELIVFLEGKGEVSYGGRKRTVVAPAVALVPAHTSHDVRNRSKSPLRYVYVYNSSMDHPSD